MRRRFRARTRYKSTERKLYTKTMEFNEWINWIGPELESKYGKNGPAMLHSSFSDGQSTEGVKSIAATLELARYGWPKGAELIKKVIQPSVEKIVPKLHTGNYLHVTQNVFGAAFDVGSYIAGQPECWSMMETTPAARPVVRILADAFISFGVDQKAFELRGAATAALVIALQKAGHPVELSTAAGCNLTASPKTVWARVMLTDSYGGLLDLNRILFMLAHPASARFLLFSYASLVGEQTYKETDDEFYSAMVTHSAPWKTDIIVPKMVAGEIDWNSEEEILKWVEEKITEVTDKAKG